MKDNDTRETIIERRNYRTNTNGDKFSLYISSWPVAINYLKKRIGDKNKILVELCCGVGITLENMGSAFKKIICVDNDKKILEECKKNLIDTNLLDKSILILGDINDDLTLQKINADIVIYDIPYWNQHKEISNEDLRNKNPDLKEIISKIRKFISKDIIIFASPHYDFQTIKEQLGNCEYQKVYINNKYDRNHIYLGSLINKDGITELKLSVD